MISGCSVLKSFSAEIVNYFYIQVCANIVINHLNLICLRSESKDKEVQLCAQKSQTDLELYWFRIVRIVLKWENCSKFWVVFSFSSGFEKPDLFSENILNQFYSPFWDNLQVWAGSAVKQTRSPCPATRTPESQNFKLWFLLRVSG